jgi:hypothetical protein
VRNLSVPGASTNLLFPASPVFIPRPSRVSPNSRASAVVFRAPRQQLDTPGHHPSIPFNPHRARVRRNHGRLPSSRCIETAPEQPPAHHSSVDARFRYSTRTSQDLARVVTWCGGRGLLTVCRQFGHYPVNPPQNGASGSRRCVGNVSPDNYFPPGTASIKSARVFLRPFIASASPLKCPRRTTTRSCDGMITVLWPPAPFM